MDIEINFGSDVEQIERVEQMLRLVLRNQLENNKEIKKVMADVAELEQEIQGLAAAEQSSLAKIDAAVTAAADRVIASLKNSGLDLTPQITELENLKAAVSSAADSEAAKIDAIDAAPAPQATEPAPATSPDATGAGE